MLLHRCGCSFECIQVFVLLREAHCAIEEMSELMQDRAGFGNVNSLLRVHRCADAVYAKLSAEIREVLRADHERPAVFVESVEDWLWNLAEFQQECIHIPLCQIFHCDRRIGRHNGQRLRQDGMKKLYGFSACDEVCCGLFSAQSPSSLPTRSAFSPGESQSKP